MKMDNKLYNIKKKRKRLKKKILIMRKKKWNQTCYNRRQIKNKYQIRSNNQKVYLNIVVKQKNQNKKMMMKGLEGSSSKDLFV